MINEDKLFSKIEERIKEYFDIEEELIEIKDKFNFENKRDVNSFIKSKGNISKGVENEAIHNILIEQELSKLLEWAEFLEKIFAYYEEFEFEKYSYSKYRYKNHYNEVKIEIKMSLSHATQYRIRKSILREILLCAIDNDLMKIKLPEFSLKCSKVKDTYKKVFKEN